MQAQIQALQAQLAAQTASPSPQAGTPAAPASGQPGAEPPVSYDLTIPPQLADALFNEDRNIAQQGMSHLINSLGKHIHERLQTQFRQELAQRDQAAQQQQTQQTQAAAAEQMQKDYYGAFPAHNNAAVKQIVAMAAGEMASQYPNLPWDARYIAALGARVNQHLTTLAGGGSAAAPALPAAPAAPTAAPAPAHAPFAPTAPRSAIPSFEADGQADVIADTFSFGG